MCYGKRILVAFLLLGGTAMAQVGHPAKGSWLGYWGTDQKSQHRIVMNLDWRNRQVVGQFNPGPNASPVTKADIDYATWTMTIEASMKDSTGRAQKWVGTGKLENLGSWTNRVYSGTYVYGTEKGNFKLTLH